jgi:hypothetical protein
MMKKLMSVAGIGAAMMVAGSANAAVITGLVTKNSGDSPPGNEYTASGNVPYFDTRLGVLNEITIFSYYQVSYTLTSYMLGDQGGQFPRAMITSDPAVIFSTDNAAFQALPDAYHTIIRETNSADYQVHPVFYVEVLPTKQTVQNLAGSQTLTVDPSLLAAFESGTGGVFNLSLSKDIAIHSDWTPDRGGTILKSESGSLFTQITYNYTPFETPPETPPVAGVPEPASWALMILGFGAVGVNLRSRRRPTLAG